MHKSKRASLRADDVRGEVTVLGGGVVTRASLAGPRQLLAGADEIHGAVVTVGVHTLPDPGARRDAELRPVGRRLIHSLVD